MRHLIIAALGIFAAGPTLAACYGSSSFQSCYDDSGNSYTVNRMGNSTYMQGNNTQTGSSWSQQSHTFGSTTMHNGVDSDGNNWSTTCYNGRCN